MTKPCFYALVDALTSEGYCLKVRRPGLPQSKSCTFHADGGMHKRHRDNMERFQHSLETINRRFHRVLSALCAMAPELITPPNFTEPHPRVANNPDSIHTSRRGFRKLQCFLAPYRGTRYHLPEWRGQGHRYRTPQDMFNHAHSRLRNVIERCFGVLKKRFPIIQWGMPSYLQHHQVDIVIACCTLHNFIRRFSNDDIIFNEPDEDTLIDMDSFYHRGHPTNSEIEAQRTIRDSIAMQMWADKHPN
ncbi:UNVERIFIED_CONTAM: hypothetical protein Sangu_1425900 [Sesamum angustifolium]|uniref:DDE Tnp4 domain-containing protein n=1 Tax=Sesamum angustifolium TaxID=2727405 RepID=A0AAW2N7V7_9LAMI